MSGASTAGGPDPGSGAPKRSGSHEGGGFATSVAFSAARGALLIGVAVIIGIVLLQVVDDGTSGPIGDGNAGASGSVTTSTTRPKASSTTTTTPRADAAPLRQPSQVAVQVLNASGVAGAAAALTSKLQAGGYATVTPNDSTAAQGTVVYCAAGLDREASALAAAVGTNPPARTAALPNPLPENGDANAACIVVAGS